VKKGVGNHHLTQLSRLPVVLPTGPRKSEATAIRSSVAQNGFPLGQQIAICRRNMLTRARATPNTSTAAVIIVRTAYRTKINDAR
jgi:hypothetical protein